MNASTCCWPISRCRVKMVIRCCVAYAPCSPPRPRQFRQARSPALAHDDDRRRALEAGFQLHMAKPIEAASLIAAVSELYDRSARVSLQH